MEENQRFIWINPLKLGSLHGGFESLYSCCCCRGAYAWGIVSDIKGRRLGFLATAVFTFFFGMLRFVYFSKVKRRRFMTSADSDFQSSESSYSLKHNLWLSLLCAVLGLQHIGSSWWHVHLLVLDLVAHQWGSIPSRNGSGCMICRHWETYVTSIASCVYIWSRHLPLV